MTFHFIFMETFLLERSTIPPASGQLLCGPGVALWALASAQHPPVDRGAEALLPLGSLHPALPLQQERLGKSA